MANYPIKSKKNQVEISLIKSTIYPTLQKACTSCKSVLVFVQVDSPPNGGSENYRALCVGSGVGLRIKD